MPAQLRDKTTIILSERSVVVMWSELHLVEINENRDISDLFIAGETDKYGEAGIF